MYALGFDVGGMSIKAGLIDNSGNVILKKSIITATSPDDAVKDVVETARLMIEEKGLKLQDISGIGIGFPGIVDSNLGKIIFLPNLPWGNFPFKEKLSKLIPANIKISNDANLATLAEVKFGSAKGYKSAVMFTLGTGVGGGVVIDGKLFEGGLPSGAELGHVTLISGGEKCGCGRCGCVEAYASASALIRQTKQKMLTDKESLMWKEVDFDIDKVDGTTAFECMKKGDESATEVYDKYASYLGDSILNMLNVFRPEIFLLGGGISNHGKELLDRVISHCQKFNYGIKGALKTEIKIASLKNDAGIIGAASLFM